MLVSIVAVLMLVTPYRQSAGHPTSAFDNLSHQAEQARDAKRLDEALGLYKQALQLKPDWQAGWWNAGSIAYDLDNYTDCASDFGRLAAFASTCALGQCRTGACGVGIGHRHCAVC